ncbi:MAG: RNA pseudouridine synthase [Planctomyces sp.]|nr:RNA pseudouridine synthase [Planctomyces sp.]
MHPPPNPEHAPPLRLVAHTAHLAVIDKPPGLLSVPGKGPHNQVSCVSQLRRLFPGATGPLVVHRLDMDTSGLMVMALDGATQRALSIAFQERRVEKRYTALVLGVPPRDRGTIDVPVRTDWPRRPRQIADPLHRLPAVTHYWLLSAEIDRARLRLSPQTGRTHQLRVHCAHIGHPILGDPLYSPPHAPAHEHPRLMLHADHLAFDDPHTGRPLAFDSAPRFEPVVP